MTDSMHRICAEYETMEKAIHDITKQVSRSLTDFINDFELASLVDPERIMWKFDKFLLQEFDFNFNTCDLKPRLLRALTNLKEQRMVSQTLLKTMMKTLAMMISVSFWNTEITDKDIELLEECGYDGSYGNSYVQTTYFKRKWLKEKEIREKLERDLAEMKSTQKVLIEEYRNVFLEENKNIKENLDTIYGIVNNQKQVMEVMEEKTYDMAADMKNMPKKVSTLVAATFASSSKKQKDKSKR